MEREAQAQRGRVKYLASRNAGGWAFGKLFPIDRPAPTFMAEGLAGDSIAQWGLYDDHRTEPPMPRTPRKPAYRVPGLADILATPDNGLTHISTFSGAGGTCLGFRLAGFRTLLANDCDPRAIACYRANLPSPIDPRPIQQLTAKEILKLTGLKKGELDVFEGSPPCTSFSLAGQRSRGWGKNKQHAGVVQQKIEDLFFVWLDLLEGLKPKAFCAENVSGMVKGVSKGVFKEVLARMIALGYVAEARLLDAQWLGVPQARQRIIFQGIRKDLKLRPRWPTPFPYRYSIRDALPWLSDKRTVHDTGGVFACDVTVSEKPAPAITVGRDGSNSAHFLVEGDGPGTADTRTRRRPPGVRAAKFHRKAEADEPAPTILANQYGRSDIGLEADPREHLAPHSVLGPDHGPPPGPVAPSRLKKGAYGEHTADPDIPSPCVTAASPGNDSVLATGPAQTDRRKFTILEVKRLCAFPDDFDLTPAGHYNHQWARLGNSVPPLMAYEVARGLRDVLLGR